MKTLQLGNCGWYRTRSVDLLRGLQGRRWFANVNAAGGDTSTFSSAGELSERSSADTPVAAPVAGGRGPLHSSGSGSGPECERAVSSSGDQVPTFVDPRKRRGLAENARRRVLESLRASLQRSSTTPAVAEQPTTASSEGEETYLETVQSDDIEKRPASADALGRAFETVPAVSAMPDHCLDSLSASTSPGHPHRARGIEMDRAEDESLPDEAGTKESRRSSDYASGSSSTSRNSSRTPLPLAPGYLDADPDRVFSSGAQPRDGDGEPAGTLGLSAPPGPSESLAPNKSKCQVEPKNSVAVFSGLARTGELRMSSELFEKRLMLVASRSGRAQNSAGFRQLLTDAATGLWAPPLRATALILEAIIDELTFRPGRAVKKWNLVEDKEFYAEFLAQTLIPKVSQHFVLHHPSTTPTGWGPSSSSAGDEAEQVDGKTRKSRSDKLFVEDRIAILQQLTRVSEFRVEVPKTIFLGFLVVYSDFLAAPENLSAAQPRKILAQIRELVDMFRRLKWTVGEKMGSLYRYAEQVAPTLDPQTAIVTALELLENLSRAHLDHRGASGSVEQLHAAGSGGDAAASTSQQEQLSTHHRKLEEFLQAVREWDYSAPPEELRRCATLNQLAHFLEKHDFPCDHATVGPYALSLCDREQNVVFMTTPDTKSTGGEVYAGDRRYTRGGVMATKHVVLNRGSVLGAEKFRNSLLAQEEMKNAEPKQMPTTSSSRWEGNESESDAGTEVVDGVQDQVHPIQLDPTSREYWESFELVNRRPFQRNMRRHLKLLGWKLIEISPEFWKSIPGYDDRSKYVRALLRSNNLLVST